MAPIKALAESLISGYGRKLKKPFDPRTIKNTAKIMRAIVVNVVMVN